MDSRQQEQRQQKHKGMQREYNSKPGRGQETKAKPPPSQSHYHQHSIVRSEHQQHVMHHKTTTTTTHHTSIPQHPSYCISPFPLQNHFPQHVDTV